MRCFLLAPFSGQQRAGRKAFLFDLNCLCGVEGCSLGLRWGDWTQELGQYWRVGVGWMGWVWVGGGPKREGIYVYVELIHFVGQQKLTQHCEITLPQLKKLLISHV